MNERSTDNSNPFCQNSNSHAIALYEQALLLM